MAEYGTMSSSLASGKLAASEASEAMDSWMSERRGLFPSLFTLACAAAFVPPVIVGMTIATDPSVVYWLGINAWFVLAVPPLLVLGHAMHAIAQAPNVAGVALSIFVPAIVIIVVGVDLMVRTNALVDRLNSGGFSLEKGNRPRHDILNEAYSAAESLFEECVSLLASGQSHQSEAHFRDTFTLQDCPAYLRAEPPSDRKVALEKKFKAQEKEWSNEWWYFSSLEQQEGCAGWLNDGDKQTLWVADWPRLADPCFEAVRQSLLNRASMCSRLIVIGSVLLLAGLGAFLTAKMTMREVMLRFRTDAKDVYREGF